jgi:hypothetical protein
MSRKVNQSEDGRDGSSKETQRKKTARGESEEEMGSARGTKRKFE